MLSLPACFIVSCLFVTQSSCQTWQTPPQPIPKGDYGPEQIYALGTVMPMEFTTDYPTYDINLVQVGNDNIENIYSGLTTQGSVKKQWVVTTAQDLSFTPSFFLSMTSQQGIVNSHDFNITIGGAATTSSASSVATSTATSATDAPIQTFSAQSGAGDQGGGAIPVGASIGIGVAIVVGCWVIVVLSLSYWRHRRLERKCRAALDTSDHPPELPDQRYSRSRSFHEMEVPHRWHEKPLPDIEVLRHELE